MNFWGIVFGVIAIALAALGIVMGDVTYSAAGIISAIFALAES